VIDWPILLRSRGVEFVESGPSTAKGNIYVHCPWCGTADQGHHLGISLFGRGWGCWKSERHRGKSAVRLLSALLSISPTQAAAILGQSPKGLSGDVMGRVQQMKTTLLTLDDEQDRKLDFTDEIKPLIDNAAGRLFLSYLNKRGFFAHDAERLCWRYKLRYALRGHFAYRLIIPIFDEHERLVTWTGRTIASATEPRYLTLSADLEKSVESKLPQAIAPITDYLLNEPQLFKGTGSVLSIGEGPLDGLKLDFALQKLGGKGTCLFGKTLSDAQYDKLVDLAPYYEHKFIVLDNDASMGAYLMKDRLRRYGYRTLHLGSAWNDPGEMPIAALRALHGDALRARQEDNQ
jgi:hypothetical protein